MVGDLSERSKWLQMQAVFRDVNTPKTAYVPNVDQTRRADDSLFHEVEQINAARFQHGAVFQFGQCLVYRRAIDVCKAVHALSSGPSLPRAAGTFAGVIAILPIRTPA